MRVRKFAAVGAALALSLAGIVAVAAPANAVGSLALSTSSFSTSTATPSMTLTASSAAFIGSAANQGIDTIVVGPGTSANWTLVNTCPAFGSATAGNAALCGIQSVVFTPTSGSPVDVTAYWKAYPGSAGQFGGVRLTKTGSNVGTDGPVTNVVGTSGTITISFNAAAFTIGSTAGASTFNLQTMYNGGGTLEVMSTAISVAGANQTVTFNSNFGTPTTSTQTANVATNLTANSFTRSGYTFRGWATSQGSNTVAYQDGASYPFTSSTTLYALWAVAPSPTSTSSASPSNSGSAASTGLASTGAETFVPFGAAAMLLVVGAAIALIRRRTAQ